MSFARHMHQTLTYWAPTAKDRYGKTGYSAPVQKACRWEDLQSTIQDKHGEEIVSKTRVALLDDVAVDGYVMLGVSAATDPTELADAYEIQQKGRAPDLRNVQSLTILYL